MKDDMTARKLVWRALSEFYLDTELKESDYDHIAEVLRTSPYDLDELKTIDIYEVFPVLKGNVISVAGEWKGFEDTWLFEGCYKAYLKRNNKMYRIKTLAENKLLGVITKEHWVAIAKRM